MPNYPRQLSTFDYRGFHRYFLTFCTFERNRYFDDADSVSTALEQILRAGTQHGFAIFAFCFMPDHVHLLVEGVTEDADLKAFLKSAKQYSGFHFRRKTRNSLWQRYGYERVLRDEEDTPSIIRYMIDNAVRAGLVKAPMDYPFWGSGTCSREALLEYIAGGEPAKAGPHD
jgi:putative transposase